MFEGKTSRHAITTGVATDGAEWIRHDPGRVYRVDVYLNEVLPSVWRAVVAKLPSVAGQGSTASEAIAELTTTLATKITRYKQAGERIPWVEAAPPPAFADIRVVFVTPESAEGVAESRITKTPGVCGGDACIRGTRLAVWGLVEWRRLGWDEARFLDAYPQLTKDDLAAAWEYAEANAEEITRSIRENEEA